MSNPDETPDLAPTPVKTVVGQVKNLKPWETSRIRERVRRSSLMSNAARRTQQSLLAMQDNILSANLDLSGTATRAFITAGACRSLCHIVRLETGSAMTPARLDQYDAAALGAWHAAFKPKDASAQQQADHALREALAQSGPPSFKLQMELHEIVPAERNHCAVVQVAAFWRLQDHPLRYPMPGTELFAELTDLEAPTASEIADGLLFAQARIGGWAQPVRLAAHAAWPLLLHLLQLSQDDRFMRLGNEEQRWWDKLLRAHHLMSACERTCKPGDEAEQAARATFHRTAIEALPQLSHGLRYPAVMDVDTRQGLHAPPVVLRARTV